MTGSGKANIHILIHRPLVFIGRFLLGIFALLTIPEIVWAAADSPNVAATNISRTRPAAAKLPVDVQWGGYTRILGSVSWPDDESFFEPVGAGPCYDHQTEFRLNNDLYFSRWGYFKTHYEAIFSGGDTRHKGKKLERLYPDLFGRGEMNVTSPVNDDRRLMDLTDTVHENDDSILTHRLDRLSLTLRPEWGAVRIGRQALTWGNGMLFNPMDLFNPFAPTDIARYYKVGDDMATIQIPISDMDDFQFLYVPRRNPSTEKVEWDESSLAGKMHFVSGVTEFDVMAAEHYNDAVVGLGGTGYLGDAVWRLNSTWTFLDKDSRADDFLSLVANMDYSWVWWGKNTYGLIEFYFNGLGDNRYTEAAADPEIAERMARGEMFTLGRTYLGGEIRMELHPLFTIDITVINNLADPSGIVQPRGVWDVAQNIQLVLGAGIYYGDRGSEYGGFEIAQSPFVNKPPDSIFLWAICFF
jgi:hypothetical protein